MINDYDFKADVAWMQKQPKIMLVHKLIEKYKAADSLLFYVMFGKHSESVLRNFLRKTKAPKFRKAINKRKSENKTWR